MVAEPEPQTGRATEPRPITAKPARGGIWLGVRRIVLLIAIFGGFWLFSRFPTLIDRLGFNLVPVAGWVDLDGEPPESARLVFIPLDRDFEFDLQTISVATIKKDGRFVLETLDGKPGAVRGRHLVFLMQAPQTTNGGGGPETATKLPDFDEPGPEGELDAWRSASDLIGFWVLPVPVRAEVSVPFFGTRSMRIELKQTEKLGVKE